MWLADLWDSKTPSCILTIQGPSHHRSHVLALAVYSKTLDERRNILNGLIGGTPVRKQGLSKREHDRGSVRALPSQKGQLDAVDVFDLEQSCFFFQQTRSWCVIHFGNIPPECLMKVETLPGQLLHDRPPITAFRYTKDQFASHQAAEGNLSLEPRNHHRAAILRRSPKETTFVIL